MTPGSASAWIEKQATRERASKGAGVARNGSESAPGAGEKAGMAGKLPYETDGKDE
jgi:hypothetical protein